MADFSIESTSLSGPQGQGAGLIAPVQELNVGSNTTPIVTGLVDLFAKSLVQDRKQAAEDRKQAVIGAYAREIGAVNDALAQGQSVAWAGLRTRAINNKYLASAPEYTTEINELHKGFMGSTEVGEAQKKVAQEQAQVASDISAASSKGYTFPPGLGKEAVNAQIDAYKYGVRLEEQTRKDIQAAQEERARISQSMTIESHQQTTSDYVAKDRASRGLAEFAAINFNAFASKIDDYQKRNVPFEQASHDIEADYQRMVAGANQLAGKFPEQAAANKSMFAEMRDNALKILDPKPKAEGELKLLEDRAKTILATSKLQMIVNDPKLVNTVVLSNLLGNNSSVSISVDPTVRATIAKWGLGEAGNKDTIPTVGTATEANTLRGMTTVLQGLQSGKIKDTPEAQKEAVNAANQLMKETSGIRPDVKPQDMKNLAAFYGSSSFGKLAEKGEIDNASMQNVKRVFEMNYEPTVKRGIIDRLNTPLPTGQGGETGKKVIDEVDIKFTGSGIVFSPRKSISGMDAVRQADRKKDLDQAASGINQLVHMGAHLERTTDYGKYWENNKHLILPNVFPDPAKLKVGQTVQAKNGKTYKYLGGDFNNIDNSYVEVPSANSK